MRQRLSAAELRDVQVTPSVESITRLLVPLRATAANMAISGAQQTENQLLVVGAVRDVHDVPLVEVITI